MEAWRRILADSIVKPRDLADRLGVDAKEIESIVGDYPMRKVVQEVSGQYYVPVLKDGDIVLTETEDILDYLDKTYGQERIADS